MEALLRQRTVGGESLELRELNERLECYFYRVGALEQENTCLRTELQELSALPPAGGVGDLERELQGLRDSVAETWRLVDRVSLDRHSLLEELRLVQESCTRQRQRRDELVRELGQRRRELEEEKRGQLGLGSKLLMLEGERKRLEEAHQEEVGRLREESARWAPSLGKFLVPTPDLGTGDWELYHQQFQVLYDQSRVVYEQELARLERAVAKDGERERSAREQRKQCQVQLHALETELGSQKQQRADLLAQVSLQQQKQTERLQKLQ
eukprot:g22279.t1